MKNLSCRTCGATLNERDLDRRLAIVTCGHCGGIYDLTKDDRAEYHDEDERISARPVAPLPEKFDVHTDPDRVTISWRWFSASDFFLIPFAIFWIGFLFKSPDDDLDPFLIMQIAFSIYLAYQVSSDLFNRTTITVDRQRLAVRHHPLPWWPAPTIDVADIEQFYVTERISRNNDSSTVYYDVLAVTRDNRSIKVLRGLEDMMQGLYLEQTFEQLMHIRDRPVAGEVEKSRVRL